MRNPILDKPIADFLARASFEQRIRQRDKATHVPRTDWANMHHNCPFDSFLPKECNFRNILTQNGWCFPEIFPEEKKEFNNNLIQYPADNYFARYLQGLANIYKIPAPNMYFHYGTDTFNGRSFEASGSIITSAANLPQVRIVQALIAHEFAHNLRNGSYKYKNAFERKQDEIFCDAFASIVEVPGFPPNDVADMLVYMATQQVTSMGVDDSIIGPRGISLITASAVDAAMSFESTTHPTLFDRLLWADNPVSSVRIEEVKEAQKHGGQLYATTLVNYSKGAVTEFSRRCAAIEF